MKKFRWLVFLPVFCIFFVSFAQDEKVSQVRRFEITNDSKKASLVFDDVRNFLNAYKLIQAGANPVETFTNEYFGKASPGLKAFANRQNMSAETLAETVRQKPALYASMKDFSEHLTGQEDAVRAALEGFKRIYPEVIYPPVYFLIGNMSAGGLADPAGILIAAEVYSLTAESDKKNLSGFSLHPVENIPFLVAHELAHIQQARLQGIEKYRAIYGEAGNLLALAIREGSADFLAELASGNHINQKVHQYGNKHEKQLWQAFKSQMNNKETGDWFFVKPADAEQPPDLGYFMGYKIAESFYRNAEDKKKAILDILSVTDYPAFLEQSGYAKKFEAGNVQNEVSKIPADTLFQIIKTRSVHRKLIKWEMVEPKFRERLNKAQTDDEILKAFVYLFSQMNDVHSAVYYKTKYYGHYKAVDEQTARLMRPLLELEQAQTGKIKTSVIAGKYGYVLIPTIQAFGADQINQYAHTIQDKICNLGISNPQGWIIDLRLNGGGNMYPMLAGLSNFLGDKIIGGFVDADDKLTARWSLKNGDVYIGKERATEIKNRCGAKCEQMPVVVLIGPITRSSGEAAAIAFKHRPDTYFIGEPTAGGYTTANEWIPVNEDLTLNLSTSYMADRQGIPYKTQVLPDLKMVGGNSFDNLSEDQKIKAAIDWLKKKTDSPL